MPCRRSPAPPAAPLLVALLLLHPTIAAAQTTTATLQGVVSDASRAALPGVPVTLRNQQTGFVRTTTTDRDGTYVLTYVPAGTYDLTLELTGFKTMKREGLRFEVGQQITLDLTLEVASIAETVVVRAEAPLVETTKSSLDQIVSREQIDTLPLPGRQFAQLALLVPGVVPRGGSEEPVTAQGQPRGSGETLVDGVSNEGMATNSIRANAPPDAIQEFQVLTSQYAAEFGNASGLILNTITRSGTNDPHGRVYYFHRDEALDATNFFATSKASFEQKQAGGWFGGPLVKDRTHYFVAYEGTRRVTIASVTSGPGKGDYEQPFDNNQLLGKVTHQINSANSLTGRVSLDRPFSHNGGIGGISQPEVAYEHLTRDLSYVGSLATVLSNRLLNELRVQVSGTRVRIDPKNPTAYTIQRPTSLSGKVANAPQGFPEKRFQVVENLTYEWGPHRLKVGVDASHVSLDGYVYQYNPGYFVFATDLPFDANNPATYPIQALVNQGDPNFAYTATGVSAFGQDAWRVAHNFTLNLGVRYDGWAMQGLDLRKANFAPRLGFAWDPFDTNKTAIRGGFGTFYSNTMFNLALLANWLSTQRILIIVSPGYPDPFSRGITAGSVVSLYTSQPDQPLPRAYNATIGVQRELRPGLSVSADYVNTKGRKLVRVVQTNPVLPTFTRQDPTKGSIQMLESSGFSNYHGLLVGVTGRLRRGTVGAAYTLSTYKTTNDAENAAYYQNDPTPDDAYGYGLQDQRHRLVLHGTLNLPGDVQLGAILATRSGTPFNITTGRDNNRNQLTTDRPDLAPGARVGTSDMTNRSSFVDPGARAGTLPRNAGRGPDAWTIDTRVAKSLRIGRTRTELLVEAFNVANHKNLNNPISNLSSASFGRSLSAGAARQVQLGFRFEF
ncbi:MAG: TonB-dependent receptor [Acidobacteria bacterium]|nr:TonB-dependent receptor [Acidobacteriota bacterium]